MKTEGTNTGDIIWTTGVELSNLAQEECFPIIGGCQVSSILSGLNPTITTTTDKFLQSNETPPQNMDLIVLQNSDYKTPEIITEEASEFVLIKDNIIESNTVDRPTEIVDVANFKQISNENNTNDNNYKKEGSGGTEEDDDVENILYFVCNLCPYLCIKDSKITEHLACEHKNKVSTKLYHLKCPACPNIFYHTISLRSHLVHDHKVNSSDLKKIIQAVYYFAKKKNISTVGKLHCKNESDLMEKPSNTEQIISIAATNGHETQIVNVETNTGNNLEKSQIVVRDLGCKESLGASLLTETVSLPMIDITHNDPAKTFSSMIKKRPDALSRMIGEPKYQKCSLPTCKVRLVFPSKMSYHVKCHEEETFRCPECNESFMFWKPLTSHLWRLHKIDMELYSCDKCDYKTFSLGKLNNIHKLIHSDFKPFICDVCQKGFKNSKQLRNHKPIHKEKNDKLMHICEICAKPFSDRRQLKIHMDGVHNKIKPYLCNYCAYRGASRSALKMHIRQHTGEKPFACDICEYTTADHNSLRRHKLRHTGHKPYKCAHCDYACIQSSTYKVHLRTKHPGLEKDLLFTCQECQFKTINKEMYMSHLFLVHRQKVDSRT